jgi:hypothetical protein
MQGDNGPHLQVVLISSVQALPWNWGVGVTGVPVATPLGLFFEPPLQATSRIYPPSLWRRALVGWVATTGHP